jgi:hypothetical protein
VFGYIVEHNVEQLRLSSFNFIFIIIIFFLCVLKFLYIEKDLNTLLVSKF